MERGKSWWKPKTEVYKGATDRGRKKDREDRIGQRGMSEMRIRSLSTSQDIAELNRYLWDIRRSIINFQVDGDKLLDDSISSTQIASGSVAGSCLAGPLVFGDSISAAKYVSAGSGFITTGVMSAATHGYIGSSFNVSGDIEVGSGAGTGRLILHDDLWCSGAVGVTQTISAAGRMTNNGMTFMGYVSGDSDLGCSDLIASGAVSSYSGVIAASISSSGIHTGTSFVGDTGAGGRIYIDPLGYNTISAGTWVWVDNNDGSLDELYSGMFYNDSTNDLDMIRYKVTLAPGTYTICRIGRKHDNRGILKIDINGTTVLTADLYVGTGLVYNQRSTASFVITTNGVYDLDFYCEGQNGSSTDYIVDFSSLSLWRTA